MEYRHQVISKEHAKTFQWIYEPTSSDSKPWTNFVHWLEEDHGLYWITGKPGSGKSTLMKFISAYPNTRKHLQTWAGGRKLVTASVDERYQEQMSTTFIVTLRARKLLPVFTYWQVDEDIAYDYVFDLETKAPPSGEARHIPINHMKKRLNARCKGLMEAKFYEPFSSGGPSSFVVSWQVDFLHRTIRDFLALANMQKLLPSRVPKSYNADLAICRSVLATFKQQLN
ncbi:hypothetical protein ACLOAV_006208 [Pseudogymnoascus australis]